MSNTQSQTSRSDHRKHATAHKRISAPFIDRLKSTTNLVDLVEKTTGRVLKKSGSSHVTNCCFHEEKTPSCLGDFLSLFWGVWCQRRRG